MNGIIKLNGVEFDDYTVDEDGNVWSQVCPNHAQDEVLKKYTTDHGEGCCGVNGCNCEDNESTVYVDFSPKEIVLCDTGAIDDYMMECALCSQDWREVVLEHFTDKNSSATILMEKDDPVGLKISIGGDATKHHEVKFDTMPEIPCPDCGQLMQWCSACYVYQESCCKDDYCGCS